MHSPWHMKLYLNFWVNNLLRYASKMKNRSPKIQKVVIGDTDMRLKTLLSYEIVMEWKQRNNICIELIFQPVCKITEHYYH